MSTNKKPGLHDREIYAKIAEGAWPSPPTAEQLRASNARMRDVTGDDALKVSAELLNWTVNHDHPAAAVTALRVVLKMVDAMSDELRDEPRH